jgi:hypothetical protein
VSTLILKRASASRPSGQWNDDDFDVLADSAVVGRILQSQRRARRNAVDVDAGLRAPRRPQADARLRRDARGGEAHRSVSPPWQSSMTCRGMLGEIIFHQDCRMRMLPPTSASLLLGLSEITSSQTSWGPQRLQGLRRCAAVSGREFLLRQCDGKLLTEMLKPEFIPFAEPYYRREFTRDYQRTLAAGLTSNYLVEDTEANYRKIAAVIEQRFNDWRTRGSRPWWKFW